MNILLDLQCQETDCTEKVVARPAFCYGCDKVLCRTHLDDLAHRGCREIYPTLAKWDRTFEDALSDLDLDALRSEIGSLRPGNTIESVEMPDVAEIDEECHGGLNIHIPILFDDGTEWMLRLSGYDRDHPPFGLLEYKRRSEVATMLALGSATDLVARVHSWGVGKLSKTQGDPRCLYILFDKKVGKSCEGVFQPNDEEVKISQASKEKFIESYADFCIQVANLSYDSIGSLTLESEMIRVGPCIDLYGVSTMTPPYFPGPFKSMRDRYITHIDRVLDVIRKGLVGRGRPLLMYLAHLVAKDLIMNDPDTGHKEEAFYIRQPDALPGQFLIVNDEITAVLDWEFANTTCKTHAFSAPEAIFGTGAWELGDNTLTEGEIMLCDAYEKRGRTDLADCVRRGRKYQRLEYVIGNAALFMYDGPIVGPYLIGILNGMVDAFLGDKSGSLPTTSHAWVEWALARHPGDSRLPEIMELEWKNELYRPDSSSPALSESEAKVDQVEAEVSSEEAVLALVAAK